MHDNFTHKDYTGYKLRVLLLTLPAAAFASMHSFISSHLFIIFNNPDWRHRNSLSGRELCIETLPRV